MMRATTTQHNFATRHRAFTLIELMVSLALVALLVLGVNEVFRIASHGVSTGQALSTAQRDNRSAQSVMITDMKNAVMPPNAIGGGFDNGPCFIIRSDRVYAFRNRADHLSDADTQAIGPPPATPEAPTDATISTRDLNGNNVETDTGELTKPAIYNDRSHRIDQLLFFARGSFRRQTGGYPATSDADDPFVARMGTAEALIWYGHLRLPDYGTTAPTEGFVHRNPGDRPYTSNKDNFYATSWILGRVQMLMRAPDGANLIQDNQTVPQNQTFMRRQFPYPNPPTPNDLKNYYSSLDPFQPRDVNPNPQAPPPPLPTKAGSGPYASSGPEAYELQMHRYDLAGTSMDEFRDILFSQGTPPDGKRGNWQLFVDGDSSVPIPFWENMLVTRYQGNVVPDKPLTAFGVAKTAPVFVRGCTQFIVEFAGDFVRQDNVPTSPTFGNVIVNDPATPVDPDGEIDFVVDWVDANNNGKLDPAELPSVHKRTRWYGMPRDIDGDGVILGWMPNANPPRTNNKMPDVVPLQDVISSGLNAYYDPNAPGNTYTPGYAIEQIDRFAPTNARPNTMQYPAGGDYAAANGILPVSRYYAVWGPNSQLAPKPKMVRITIALDDPAGTMAAEQTYEYVIDVP